MPTVFKDRRAAWQKFRHWGTGDERNFRLIPLMDLDGKPFPDLLPKKTLRVLRSNQVICGKTYWPISFAINTWQACDEAVLYITVNESFPQSAIKCVFSLCAFTFSPILHVLWSQKAAFLSANLRYHYGIAVKDAQECIKRGCSTVFMCPQSTVGSTPLRCLLCCL